jgi:hypothetical protein
MSDEPKYGHMIKAKYDHCRVEVMKWAIFLPDLLDDLRLATDEQLIDYAGFDVETVTYDEGIRPVPGTFTAAVLGARPCDWIPFKEGIALRLGSCIDPAEWR